MAIHQKQSGQQIEALLENLQVVNYCLHYNKDEDHVHEDFTVPCLGYPAAILLCSLIDTIGSFFRGSQSVIMVDSQPKTIETASDHFLILNHNILFNLNLSGKTIFDFYSTYRSRLTHNNSLPPNNFLIATSISNPIFRLNANDEVEIMDLVPLFKKVEDATSILIHWLKYGQWSSEHKLTQELNEKAKADSSIIKDFESESGNTITNISK